MQRASKLMATGLFEGCNWKYAPTSRTGVTLSFQVKEAAGRQKVRLSVPGVGGQAVMGLAAGERTARAAANARSDEAIQFYTRAIQRFLKKDVDAHGRTESGDSREHTRYSDLPMYRPSYR